MKVAWDYTELAKAYLKRPDYSEKALEDMFKKTHMTAGKRACDVGAGVAHLTLPLLRYGLSVVAVEPNDEMRKYGSQRTEKMNDVKWIEGTGEDTRQPSDTFDLVTFGSSFNVTDRQKALQESHRILCPKGWFACMWNLRDLEDPTQKAVEDIITKHVPDYDYGTRRQDQTQTIINSGLFNTPEIIEGHTVHKVDRNEWVEAWNSHATLSRQAKDKRDLIVEEIKQEVAKRTDNTLDVPYVTKIWIAQKK